MKDFKTDLKEHLLKFQTCPYLFIGSGLSRRYLNLPTWLTLLEQFSQGLYLSKQFEYYQSIANGNLPLLASNMAKEFHEIWWTNDEFLENRNQYKQLASLNKNSPFKIELSKFINDTPILNSEFAEEIELLKNAIIDGIITTNWDSFLNEMFKDFNSYIGQDELMFSNSFSVGELFKIHGCCSNPNSIIVTEEDYENFNAKYAYLTAKLLTIFVEHPIIFLGYSISDKNITEILNSIVSCVDNYNIEKLKDRLLFVEWSVEAIEPSLSDGVILLNDGRILPIKKILIHDYKDLYEVLANLKKRLPIKILRNFKDSVYEFVKANNSSKTLYVGDLTDFKEGQDIEFVVGVGVTSSFSEQGYKGIVATDLVEDVINDNKKYEAGKLLEQTLPSIIQSTKIYIPIYKYLRQAKFLDSKGNLIANHKLSTKVIGIMKGNNLENYYPPTSYAKKKTEIRKKYQTLNALIKGEDLVHSLYYIPLLDKSKIDLVELRKFLKQTLKSDSKIIKDTSFKKVVCLYDYLKYGFSN